MSFSELGYEIIDGLITQADVNQILAELESVVIPSRSKNIRNVELHSSFVRQFVKSDTLINLANQKLGADSQFVRAILFDKDKDNNWSVTWHQDLT